MGTTVHINSSKWQFRKRFRLQAILRNPQLTTQPDEWDLRGKFQSQPASALSSAPSLLLITIALLPSHSVPVSHLSSTTRAYPPQSFFVSHFNAFQCRNQWLVCIQQPLASQLWGQQSEGHGNTRRTRPYKTLLGSSAQRHFTEYPSTKTKQQQQVVEPGDISHYRDRRHLLGLTTLMCVKHDMAMKDEQQNIAHLQYQKNHYHLKADGSPMLNNIQGAPCMQMYSVLCGWKVPLLSLSPAPLVPHNLVKKSYCDNCGQYCDCDIINKRCHE